MKIFVAGGTGFIGKALVKKLLTEGETVIVASRNPKKSELNNLKYVVWDGATLGDWQQEVDGSDAVINLAGEGIFEKRWTKEFKQNLLESRLAATGILVEAIKLSQVRPRLFISASAVGYYGDTKDAVVDETSPPGDDFLAEICIKWEEEARRAAGFNNVRVVHPRIGIVLGENGGALKQMVPPFKAFMGGPVGSGEQWFPWVHISDVVEAILFPLENEKLAGPYNVAAPGTLRLKDFCQKLGEVLGRPSSIKVPQSILKLILGEAADSLLSGQHISCKKLTTEGFKFKYADATSALRNILK